MRLSFCLALCITLVLAATHAYAADGYITYKARVVHNSRKYLSYVTGTVDLARGDFTEQVQDSYSLNWRVVPGSMEESSQSIPSIWQQGDQTCQRFHAGLPRFNSPLLRHFIVGNVMRDVRSIKADSQYMSGQLVVLSAEVDEGSFEIVASYMGAPLVIVGRMEEEQGVDLVKDLAVLGASQELYQYFIDDISYNTGEPTEAVSLPEFNPEDYVTFPEEGSGETPIRPVKDWLVFQAQLPNGRPLNLVFDSGAETMIIDDLVLKVDAQLEPAGDMLVSGAFEDGKMQLYEGFEFEIGGVQFKNLPVAGAMLTTLGFGANMRIHGIVGNEILQLCRLDLDLADGSLLLTDPKSPRREQGEQVALTFIHDLPHVKAGLQDNGSAWLLVDTGQQAGLQVNIDYLEDYQLGDDLVMYGFHSDITGGLRPRYMIEELDLSLGGTTYREKTVDALMESSFDHEGVPVVGSIGFPLLARHFGGITFDYSRQLMYLRDPSDNYVFAGRPEAWSDPVPFSASLLADADIVTDNPAGGKPGTDGTPATGKKKPASSGEKDTDPRAGYPWYEQHLALAEQLGDIRSSAPMEQSAAGGMGTSKDPFGLPGGERVNITDRLVLFSLAEVISSDIQLYWQGAVRESTRSEWQGEGAEPVDDAETEEPVDIFRRDSSKLQFAPLTEDAPDYFERQRVRNQE